MRNVRIFNSVIAVGGALLAGSVVLAQGQVLGFGSLQPPSPASVLGYRFVAGGGQHTVAIRRDGSVAAWGQNSYGQCSVPAGLSEVTKVAAGGSHSAAISRDGRLLLWGSNGWNQSTVPAGLGTARDVACGYWHTLAVDGSGFAVAWGAGTTATGTNAEYGQSIVPAQLGTVEKVACGYYHSLAVRSDGILEAWGAGKTNTGSNYESGQSIVPASLGVVRQAAGGSAHTVALKTDGSVVAWGSNSARQCNVPANLGIVTQVGAGSLQTVVLKQDGTIATWGLIGSTIPVPNTSVTQVSSGSAHVVGLRSDGGIFGWGNNSGGQVSLAGALSAIIQVDGGGSQGLALKSDGTVIQWAGAQVHGVVPSTLSGVVQVVGGTNHSVARKSNGSLVAWGQGTLNTGVSPNFGHSIIPTNLGAVTDVAAGLYHTVAVKIDGTVAAWGAGTTATETEPHYGQSVVPSNLTGVVQVAAGKYHTVAVRTDGSVAAWGAGTVAAGVEPNWGQSVVPVALGQVARIAAGDYHSVALKSNGGVAAWGAGTIASFGPNPNWGQSVIPAGLGQVTQVAAGGLHTVALKSNGTVSAWGWNQYGQCSIPSGLNTVSQIAASSTSTLLLLTSSASSCANPLGSGTATLTTSGCAWQDFVIWTWSNGGGPQVPGALSNVNLGTSGSVASACSSQAATLQTDVGTSLLVPAAASTAGNDYSIRVGTTANLAGRVWLLGVDGAGSTLPENLNIPVLSAGTVNGNFDLIQSELPPPPGFFLTLVPEDVNGRTVFSLRLLPLPGGGELTASSTGTFSGKAVAAETIDINHDGFDDLALAVDFGAAQPGLIQILLNDGAGGLGSTSVLTSIPPQPTCLAVGDVDGDGDRDVAVGISSDSTARVYLDNGAGGLTASSVFSSASGTPISIAIVEPGGASLMAASGFVAVGTSGSKLRIYRDSSLQQEITLAGAPGALRPGKTDVIRPTGINTGGTRTASIDGLLPVAETGFMQTLTLAPSGLFEIRQTFLLNAKPVAMDVADLDGDGLDDIVTTNTDPVLPATGSALPVLSIFRNSGGTFGGGVPFQPATASSGLDVSLIDVDNDGDRDIVSVYKRVGSDSEAALLRVDTLGPGTPISIGQTTVLDASDPILSARGNLDGSGGEDLFLVNQPSGAFLTGTQEVKPFLATGGLKQGDLDGDGTVGASDIGMLLLDFGPCPGCASDLDGSGEVDAGDLSFLLLLFD